jgi:hypothetical protein
MAARQDRQKVHHGRRKKGQKIRRRAWALRHNRKVRKQRSRRR